MVTGQSTGVIVLDADLPKPGEEGLLNGMTVVAENEVPADTPVQRTGSGGRHFFFSMKKSIENGLLRCASRNYCLR